jgi:hypothetical protein
VVRGESLGQLAAVGLGPARDAGAVALDDAGEFHGGPAMGAAGAEPRPSVAQLRHLAAQRQDFDDQRFDGGHQRVVHARLPLEVVAAELVQPAS